MDYPIRSTGLITVMLLTCPPAGSAAENLQSTDSGSLPSLEFLEFLGRFETDSGEWVNPEELMQAEFEQLLKNVEDTPIQPVDADKLNKDSELDDADNGDEV